MGVNIQRAVGQLNRTEPTEDNVICLVMSGAAVAGKIALGEPKQIFTSDALTTLGITESNNPLAHQEILDFYTKAGEGAELNIMLVVDTTSLTNICDNQNQLAKKLLDFTQGRGVILAVNRKVPEDYEPTIVAGLDSDVNGAITKMNELAVAFQAQNLPFVGILPALGFDKDTIADMPARSTLANDNVALNPWCLANNGLVSMGMLLGWMTKFQVHQNIGRVASGKVADTAFMPDGTDAKDLKYSWDTIADKGLLVPIKIGGKSGYFFKDDPTMTKISSDYSSLSWNRVINKAQRISYGVLVEKLNDDVDIDPATGKIDGSLISDWESDVENAIKAQMMQANSIKQKEISGIKCSIDPDSDIRNDQVSATIDIVRKGQAKTISVRIGYVEAL